MTRSLGWLAGVVALPISPLLAATWRVPQDAPTIAAAVALSAPGDSVVIACGTYPEHDIVIPHALTITSETGQPDCVTIDAGSLGRVFLADEPVGDARIEGLTLTGGLAEGPDPWSGWGGGMLFIATSPTLERCVFSGNRATGGGGLAIAGHGAPVVTDCVFEANSAEHGGGVLGWVTTATLSGCTFRANTADSLGGGLAAMLASVSITGSTFQGNAAPEGGALHADLDTQCTVDNAILAFCAVGEAVWCDSTSSAALTCCDVFGNAGGDWVGALAGQQGVNGNFAQDPLFCDAPAGDLRLASGSPCLPGNHPDGADCALIGAHGGCASVGVPGWVSPLAVRLTAQPNPFRGSVHLAWELPRPADARITIFDVDGRRVRAFDVRASSGVLRWDGRTEEGRASSAGPYFVRLESSAGTATRRVLLLR